MSELDERVKSSNNRGGAKNFGSLVGLIAIPLGILGFIGSFGYFSSSPDVDLIRYGSLAIIVLGLLLRQYAEKSVEEKSPKPVLDGLDAVNEVYRIAVKSPLADYSRGSFSCELLCKEDEFNVESKVIMRLVGQGSQSSFELMAPPNTRVIKIYETNGSEVFRQNQQLCVLSKEYDPSWWRAIPLNK